MVTSRKILIVCILLVLAIGSMVFLQVENNLEQKRELIIMEENKQYQGPVPEGFDEEHFRKTGITKPLEE